MTADAALTRAVASSLAVMSLLVAGIPGISGADGTRGEPLILNVGGMYDRPILNPLPAMAGDVWTHDVLDRVYDTVGKALPDTDALVPYILKGIDADDDGVFETSEYEVFSEDESKDILNVTAYYDFNGVYFHDGEQATAGDLFFSYHLRAMNPRSKSDVSVLMDKAGRSGSNYSTAHWLFVTPATKDWQDEPAIGNSSLRFAATFRLQEPYALFYNTTLAKQILFPRHVWEGTGWRTDVETGARVSPLHADFGLAIYPESDPRFGQGVPTTETTYKPYQYLNSGTPAVDSAEEWEPRDDDVIGTGPFEFLYWGASDPWWNVSSASVWRNPLYFAGIDRNTGETVDAFIATYVKGPFIDGIHFQSMGSSTMCITALQYEMVDICRWSIPPQYELMLAPNPNIRFWSRLDPGFAYIGYDMRTTPAGVWHWGQPDQFDVGYHFRKAISHMLDKSGIVKDVLQGYGVPGVVPVSPANTRYYNTSLVPYAYNETLAKAEIDLAHQDALWLSTHGGPPDAATWFTYDSSDRLILPGAGTSSFSLYCPYYDVDLQWLNACSMYVVPALRKLGAQVVQKPFYLGRHGIAPPPPPWEMYVWGWRVGGDDPGYLYDLFHSSSLASGLNYIGFNDPIMDSVLDQTRREINGTRRTELFKWAESILLDKLPCETLFFRTNIEGTNQGRFVGWLPLHGTVWNYWSLLNIRPPGGLRIHLNIEGPSAMVSDSVESVAVNVLDWNGEPVDGAKVTLTVEPPWAGNFSFGGGPSVNEITALASLGRLQASYIAPRVGDTLNVTITAEAVIPNLPEIPEESRSFVVAVFPADVQFLSVKVDFLDSDIVASSDSLRFGIEVTDPQGFPVHDARVNASVDTFLPPPYGIQPREGNATAMGELAFFAPHSSLLEHSETLVVLKVDATAPGTVGGSARVGFVVVKVYTNCPGGERLPLDVECPVDRIPNTSMIVISVTGLAFLAVLAIFILRGRKRL